MKSNRGADLHVLPATAEIRSTVLFLLGRNAIIQAMLDPDLLSLLRCPITHSPLSVASPTVLGQINQLIDQRQLKTRQQLTVENSLSGALLNSDCSWALPVHGDIPNLIPGDALDLSQIAIDYSD